MNLRHILFCLALLGMTIGCTTESHSYDVAVQNKLDKPITFWLVKEHGPMQEGWLSPEQIATLASPPPEDKMGDVVVPPGETATTKGALAGDFDKGSGHAVLRIYHGTPTLTQMLAINRGSMSRLDVPLEPGPNHIVVRDNDGMMEATKREAGAMSPPSPSAPQSSLDSNK